MRIKQYASLLAATLFAGATLLAASVPGAAASTTPGGTISIFSDQTTTTNNGATGPIVITGVIGDYGTATSIDQNGKVDSNGNYVKVALKKGSFEINSVAFDAAVNNATPTANSTNCSGSLSATGSVTVFDGSGAYAGIGGTIKVTAEFAFVGPKLTNGKCNETNSAEPIAQYGTITGSGAVTF
jgi:hypothetical protein